MTQLLRQLVFAVVASFAATSANAIPIASWALLGATGDQTSTAGVGSAHVSALNLSRGAGLTPNAGANSLNSRGWNTAPASNPGDDTDYVTFGFSVAPGFAVDLTDLIIGTRSSATGPGTVGLFWSGDGFVTALATITQPNTAYVDSVIDLSALTGLAGLNEFRLIEIGNTQADGSGDTTSLGTFRVTDYLGSSGYQDTQFSGEIRAVSVPEPSTVALLGLGVVGIRYQIRRKFKA